MAVFRAGLSHAFRIIGRLSPLWYLIRLTEALLLCPLDRILARCDGRTPFRLEGRSRQRAGVQSEPLNIEAKRFEQPLKRGISSFSYSLWLYGS